MLRQRQRLAVPEAELHAWDVMPNAFGQADLFGRTRPTGLAVLQYAGIRNGKALLLRSGVVTQSDATTMSSTPLIVPTSETTSVSGTVDSRTLSGTATRSGSMYIPPRPASVTSMQQPTVPMEIDWRQNPRVPIAGRTLVIEAADARSIVYRIE